MEYKGDFKKPSEDVIAAAKKIINEYNIDCYVQ
jgi:hypothetical protein